MGITERKEKQKLELRKQILDASMKLFIEEGFDKVSIRRIADLIEYSPTTIYLYFKDKNEILFALHEMGFQNLNQYNQNLLNIANPLIRLHKMGENYLNFAIENPEYYDLMFIQNAPMEAICDKDWEHGDTAFNSLQYIVMECMEKGLIKTAEIDVVVLSIWSFVHGLASLIIKQRLQKMKPEIDIKEILNKNLNWMIKIIDTSSQ